MGLTTAGALGKWLSVYHAVARFNCAAVHLNLNDLDPIAGTCVHGFCFGTWNEPDITVLRNFHSDIACRD